ncbi:MAG: CRTAC1 family protein [Planctomycetota bacterium]|jgi:hypothetical protein
MRHIPIARMLLCGCVASAGVSAQLVFDEVASACGVDTMAFGRGAAMVDLDGDGLLDIIKNSAKSPDVFLRQLNDNTFVDVSSQWGIPADDLTSWGVLAVDFDNDGDADVYTVAGGFSIDTSRLLRNDLDTLGVFTDVSAQSGDAGFTGGSFGGTVLDYDLDGDLDIFVAKNFREDNIGACVLLRNDGGLVFTDVSVQAGVALPGDYRHCSMGDVDNDGWPDIAVGRANGDNRLFRNNRDGTFTDIAPQAGLGGTTVNFGMVLEDFDNDGWMDVYVPRYQFELDGPSGLFVNNGDFDDDGNGTFTDVSLSSGIGGHKDMGHSTGDVDADGYPDVFVGTGSPWDAEPDFLYLITPDGSGGLTATDASLSSGLVTGALTRAHGSAYGDFDEDGDIDVMVNPGGPGGSPETIEPGRLYRNQGNAHGWIAIDLLGRLSSRTAVGARAVAITPSGKQVHRQLTAGKGFANTDSPTLHFGLASEAAIDRLIVRWPSGLEQTLLAPAASTRHSVSETGMRLVGGPTTGTSVMIELCGPANHVAEVFGGTSTLTQDMIQYGGVLRVAPPFFGPVPMVLSGTGRLDIPFAIPDIPAMKGVSLFLQSWTHAPGATTGGTLSGLVEMSFS